MSSEGSGAADAPHGHEGVRNVWGIPIPPVGASAGGAGSPRDGGRALQSPLGRYLWHNLNGVSQLFGAMIAYTRTNNDSISGDSEWFAQDVPLYGAMRRFIDAAFYRLIGQRNHCFGALYNDYLKAQQRVREFEHRYGKGVHYDEGGPVPKRIR